MVQIKEEEKSPEKELSEMEANNLSDIEFKAMVIRMVNSFRKYKETILKKQSEMKNTLKKYIVGWKQSIKPAIWETK